MSDIADKIYAATGLTLNAEAAAKIGQMIQAENEKLRAALKEVLAIMPVFPAPAKHIVGMADQYNDAITKARAALGEKECKETES